MNSLTLFKLLLGIKLRQKSRLYLTKRHSESVDQCLIRSIEKDLDTPHHMLPASVMNNLKSNAISPGRSSVLLDDIDRFTMVKSRIP
jgi:hypothetical protein